MVKLDKNFDSSKHINLPFRNKFKSKEICKITGISKSKLEQWVFRGIVQPSTPSKGTGYPAIFDIRDLLYITIVNRLVETGLKTKTAMSAIESIKFDSPEYIHLEAVSWGVVNLENTAECYTSDAGKPDVDFPLSITIRPSQVLMELIEKIEPLK